MRQTWAVLVTGILLAGCVAQPGQEGPDETSPPAPPALLMVQAYREVVPVPFANASISLVLVDAGRLAAVCLASLLLLCIVEDACRLVECTRKSGTTDAEGRWTADLEGLGILSLVVDGGPDWGPTTASTQPANGSLWANVTLFRHRMTFSFEGTMEPGVATSEAFGTGPTRVLAFNVSFSPDPDLHTSYMQRVTAAGFRASWTNGAHGAAKVKACYGLDGAMVYKGYIAPFEVEPWLPGPQSDDVVVAAHEWDEDWRYFVQASQWLAGACSHLPVAVPEGLDVRIETWFLFQDEAFAF